MYAVGLEKNSQALVIREVSKPFIEAPNQALVKVLYAGICGTDRSMIRWDEKDFPPGEDFLILGHEAVGRVEVVGPGVKALHAGDLVVPTVRHGCGQCAPCRNGQSDMCRTGLYRERGIHKLHGFFTEYFVDEEEYLVKVPSGLEDLAVLTEPLSVSEKAISQLRTLQLRMPWLYTHHDHQPGAEKWGHDKIALVVGAGPIGLLGTALLRLGDAETYVIEIVEEEHIKVQLIRELGAHYVDGRGKTTEDIVAEIGNPDIILEASGTSQLALSLMPILARNGVYIFTGIPRGESEVRLDGNLILRQVVRYNHLIIGSLNSNREHFVAALHDMAELRDAFGSVLDKVITHRYRLLDYQEVFQPKGTSELKVIFDMQRQ
jgi:threonine dehydrogenase-like Zn-dependent dehydrogenase